MGRVRAYLSTCGISSQSALIWWVEQKAFVIDVPTFDVPSADGV